MRIVLSVLTLCIALLFLPTTSLNAAADRYSFSTPEEQQRFDHLLLELRCLVCQNQTLADSNAPLAEDLRQQVYEMIEQGQSNEVITAYLVKRYGEFVLFDPPFNYSTYLLWFAPLALLVTGLLILFCFIKKRRID